MTSLALSILAAVVLLTGCAGGDTAPPKKPDDWVVVVYEVKGKDPTMWSLVDTELAADKALQESGAGIIDGNEVGPGSYELYFVGSDRDEMWRILEPILAEAPVRWSHAELRHGLGDEDPVVVDH
jgi:hypothetical protein